ncbi:MAG: hydrogenase nickel incorporation protein HypB [Deltaproteobacteria bacterium]|nr:hydrogenase nickel incorporation protein HypB [Candidatus Anaeroferrophillacea bacterium]
MCDQCGCRPPAAEDAVTAEAERPATGTVTVDVNERLLAANDEQAAANRRHVERLGAVAVNLISSPGAGKTSLLERTIAELGGELKIGVLEGDIETERDAERLRAYGVPVAALTTGGACHLDAPLVHRGLHRLETATPGGLDLIFIENVGNLVCPATFFLGEHARVVLLSVPEGDDKPAKYPRAFSTSQLFVITKTDLLPYFDFSVDAVTADARGVNPGLPAVALSAVTGAGFAPWIDWLRKLRPCGRA